MDDPKGDPRVAIKRGRSARAMRCAFCHSSFDDGWEVKCPCGAVVHFRCLLESAHSCPTCGLPSDVAEASPGAKTKIEAELQRVFRDKLCSITDLVGGRLRSQAERIGRIEVLAYVCLASVLATLMAMFGPLREVIGGLGR